MTVCFRTSCGCGDLQFLTSLFQWQLCFIPPLTAHSSLLLPGWQICSYIIKIPETWDFHFESDILHRCCSWVVRSSQKSHSCWWSTNLWSLIGHKDTLPAGDRIIHVLTEVIPLHPDQVTGWGCLTCAENDETNVKTQSMSVKASHIPDGLGY